MTPEPKDYIALYAAVVATFHVGWNIFKSSCDQSRMQKLESQESHRKLTVKYIQLDQVLEEVKDIKSQLNLQPSSSNTATQESLNKINKDYQEIYSLINPQFLSDKARAEYPKSNIDKLRLEPMHKKVDELLAKIIQVKDQLSKLQNSCK